MSALRKAQARELLEKITPAVAGAIIHFSEKEKWTDKEIYDETGVTQNRLSELKNFKKYQRSVNQVTLRRLVRGGIISMSELIQDVTRTTKLTEKEIEFLEEFEIFGDPVFDREARRAYREKKEGKLKMGPGEILKAYREGKLKPVKG